MTKILLNGCTGKMGRVVAECVAKRDDCEIAAGVDINTQADAGFPVFANAGEFRGDGHTKRVV